MINVSDRSKAIMLIDEAVTSGARRPMACKEIGLTERTYYRWVELSKTTGGYVDEGKQRSALSQPTSYQKRSAEKLLK